MFAAESTELLMRAVIATKQFGLGLLCAVCNSYPTDLRDQANPFTSDGV